MFLSLTSQLRFAARPVGRIGGKPPGLMAEALLGSLDHAPGCADPRLGGWRVPTSSGRSWQRMGQGGERHALTVGIHSRRKPYQCFALEFGERLTNQCKLSSAVRAGIVECGGNLRWTERGPGSGDGRAMSRPPRPRLPTPGKLRQHRLLPILGKQGSRD
jgi:hypothetical protein